MNKLYPSFIFCLMLKFTLAQQRSTILTPNFKNTSKKEMYEVYEKLNQEINLDPGSHKAYYTRSWLRYTLRDTLGAIEDIEKAISLDPENAGYHYLHAYQIIDFKRYGEVISECEGIMKKKKNADVYILYGHALDAIGNYEEARKNYRQALSIDSLYDDAYMRMALSFGEVKDYTNTRVWTNKLLQKYPTSEEGLKILTSLNLLTKNYKVALESADRMIAAKKRVAEAYEMKAAAYDSLGNRKEACQCMLKSFHITHFYDIYEYIMSNCPDEQKDRNLMLNHLQIEGHKANEKRDFQTAYKFFSQAVELEPDSASSYYNRGKAKRNLEDHRGAIEDYQIAIKKNPRFSPAYVGMGVSYTYMNQMEEAKKTYLKCIEIDPFNEMAYYNYGDLLRSENNCEDAISYFKHAAMLKPDYVRAFYWLGDCYGKTNKNVQACEAFRTAEKLGDAQAKTQRIWYCR